MSTLRPTGISTLRPINMRTERHNDKSTVRRTNISTVRPINMSTVRPINMSTVRRTDVSTLRPPDMSTVLPPDMSTMSTFRPTDMSTMSTVPRPDKSAIRRINMITLPRSCVECKADITNTTRILSCKTCIEKRKVEGNLFFPTNPDACCGCLGTMTSPKGIYCYSCREKLKKYGYLPDSDDDDS